MEPVPTKNVVEQRNHVSNLVLVFIGRILLAMVTKEYYLYSLKRALTTAFQSYMLALQGKNRSAP